MDEKYGLLLNKDIKLHRKYFEEMVKLIGIYVIYRAPKKDKHWTSYAEIESNYEEPLVVGCIFDEHPNQKTMKKLGWVSELSDTSSLISVPYDLPNIQVGSLFIIPSGLDRSIGRLFRVSQLTNTMIYPSSITCEIVPEYEDTYDIALYDHKGNSFNLLDEEKMGVYSDI